MPPRVGPQDPALVPNTFAYLLAASVCLAARLGRHATESERLDYRKLEVRSFREPSTGHIGAVLHIGHRALLLVLAATDR